MRSRATDADVDCTTIREAISARLDGEAGELELAAVDRHLATCARCRHFAHEAERLHRTVRVTAAEAVPDLTRAILDRVRPPRKAPAREAARVALALLAVAQVLVTIATLGDGHSAHDIAAWELALGGAFGWAAWRPSRSAGILPALGGVAIVQLLMAGADVVRAPDPGVGRHLAAVVGWYLLTQLHGGRRAILTTATAA